MDAFSAEFSIDNTCQTCTRRYNDSINVNDRRAIRVNQVGFRPQDPKKAFVANPIGSTFRVINAETGAEAWSGTLDALGSVVRPPMWVQGNYKVNTPLYTFGDSAATVANENLYQASFSDLSAAGRYFVIVGADTSATFRIDDKIYNYIFEASLQFFGSNRCGDTHSWIHGPCHLKDGSAIGKAGALAGGWHDCGDHFKVSETIGYSALVLTMTYAFWPEKAEDFFGESYYDTLPFGTDGIPDLLYEAKVGVDYIFKLYKASKADGLIAKGDMYHSVGVDGVDHNYWDKPERQDAQPPARGGPDRVVVAGAGTNVVGMYAGAMAFFAWGWEVFDKPYADSLKLAAKDLYDNLIMPNVNAPKATSGLNGFYPGAGRLDDDPAAAALGLLLATKDRKYYADLVENTAIRNNPTAKFNDGEFSAGHFGNGSGFHHGGWTTDYESVHSYVMYGFAKLILGTEAKAAEYGVSKVVRDSLLEDAVACLRTSVSTGSNGAVAIPTKNGKVINADKPYGGVFTSVAWGFNRYNMGMVNELFMMWDLTGEMEYFDVGLDNLNYNMGMNPWDISFIMGVGEKNLQHPHNRAANPDEYNAGGIPYKYTCPRGALMGGAKPNATLKDLANDFVSTETCIDFSAQFVMPAQMLAKDLPPDNSGPVITNVMATPIDGTTELISWTTDELAQVTVYLSLTKGGALIDTLSTIGVSKAGSVTASGLTTGKKYYYYLVGQDIRRNQSTENNHGEWYSFTATASPAAVANVRICQVDDQTAKIYWWTTNGAYPTTLSYGSSSTALSQSYTGDNGQPVMFHEALLTGLSAGTHYYFKVTGDTKAYDFSTTANPVYHDYTITLKPTNKKGASAHFYMEVINNESKPYTGLEVRWYFKTKTILPATVNVKGFDNQIFDVGGNPSMATYTYGAAVQVAGTDQWYIPITIVGVLPVAGRARIEMEIHTNGWGDMPWSELVDSWSLKAHKAATDPIYFEGIDLAKGLVYIGPEHVETVNGAPEVTYTEDPYIAAYFNGTHIFGYPPDFATGSVPVQKRNMFLNFTSPFKSPQTTLEQEVFKAEFNGTAWVKATGNLNAFEFNGLDLTASAVTYPVSGRTDSLEFSHTVGNLGYGANRQEFVAWHNASANSNTDVIKKYDCACAYQRLQIEVDTLVVPREKRMIHFEPADSVKVYQGKRKLVRVTLTDSAGIAKVDEDFSLSLGAGLNGFKFWADPTSTIAITRATLVGGEAQFYVSYESVLTADVVTTFDLSPENGKSEYNYIVENPVLVAQPPPPWPIIESAKMVDTDCDQVPDALDINLTGSFESGRYDFTQVEFEFEGDTLTVKSKTDVGANAIRVQFTSPSGKVNTASKGQVWLSVNVASKGVQKSDETYSDGVGPVVVSVSILEKDPSSTVDSLFVQFSEPVSAGVTWMFKTYSKTGVAVTDTPSVVGAKIFNSEKNIWVYVIKAPAGGKQPIAEGVSVQLLSGAPIVDRNGNTADACTFAKLKVSMKRRPVPMDYASISDSDGDGRADFVTVKFTKAVDVLHQPDSISVIFGFFQPETLMVGSWKWNSARTEASISLSKPFAFGNTAGTYSGVYNGAELVNAGLAVQHKGLGADYESGEIAAEDRTGPVILSANSGQSRLIDSLRVMFSEPVVALGDSVGKVLILRERGGSVALLPIWWTISGDGTSALFIYNEDNIGYVTEGDRIRLDPSVSRFTDISGNKPSIQNPWATVRGTSAIKVEVDVAMEKNVTRAGTGVGYGKNVPGKDEPFRITIMDPRKGTKDIWKAGKLVTTGIDTNGYKTQGPTFMVNLGIPRGSGYGEPAVWDSVRINIDILVYSNLGNYVNRVTQTIMLHDGDYLDSENRLRAQVEWTSQDGLGPVSSKGRVVGSGAYVGKALVSTQMWCINRRTDVATQLRYHNKKSSHSENWAFGYLRGK
jgi:hypothetical protein